MSNVTPTQGHEQHAVSEPGNQTPAPAPAVTATNPWASVSGPSLPSVDTDNSDVDSGIAVITTSSTASLRSSIYEHVEENGRTYHRYKQGKYPLPNDEQEQERLDLQHALFGVTLQGRLHLAPLKPDIYNVLDVATGTGIWAIEFAQQYPNSRVVGTDLSAIQPTFIPSNCRFEIDDMEDEWSFSDKFDLIHGRALISCLRDPTFVFTQAFHALNPGGYLELHDGTFPHQYIGDPPVDSHFYKWNELVTAGAAKLGRPWTHAANYKQIMEEIGFVDVVEKRFYWPTSTWPKGAYLKEVSRYWQEDLLKGIEGISLKVATAGMGWTAESVRELLEHVKVEIKSTKLHAWLPIYVVYGRKPETAA